MVQTFDCSVIFIKIGQWPTFWVNGHWILKKKNQEKSHKILHSY